MDQYWLIKMFKLNKMIVLVLIKQKVQYKQEHIN